MKKKLYITITNNISYDQRMDRIATSLSKIFDVVIVGSNTRNPPKLIDSVYKAKRLKTFMQKGKWFYLEFNIRLFFFFMFKKMDILYSVDLDTLSAGVLLRKSRNIQLVYDSHEYFTELPELQDRNRIKKIWTFIEKIGFKTADKIITVNKELQEIYSDKYGKDILVLRNMPFLSKIEKGSIWKNKIIYQGAINEGRGLREMIHAMVSLRGFNLEIAGSGPKMIEMKELVSKLNLNNVHFHGMLNKHELRHLAMDAFLGVNLLENRSLNYYYSLANKFFDYVEVCLPSINMHYPAYQRLNEKFEVSILIEDLNVLDIVETIKKLEKDQILYSRLTKNCEIARTKWNWGEEEKVLLESFV